MVFYLIQQYVYRVLNSIVLLGRDNDNKLPIFLAFYAVVCENQIVGTEANFKKWSYKTENGKNKTTFLCPHFFYVTEKTIYSILSGTLAFIRLYQQVKIVMKPLSNHLLYHNLHTNSFSDSSKLTK